MADAGGLQLLPSQKKHISLDFVSGKSRLLILAAVILVLLGVAYGVIANLKSNALASIATIDGELERIHKARDKQQEDKLLTFSRELFTVRSLLQSHIFWSVGFASIESMIEPRVQFSTLTADAQKKTYSFHATADNYATVARQLASFYANAGITDVKLNKVGTTGGGKVDFIVDITFQADKFLIQTRK